MRDLILEAAQSGDIEELRPAIERNETLPIFSTGAERPRTFADAVEFLKKQSFDGQGRETLSIIAAILDQPYAKITRGPAVTYEWPAFSRRLTGEASEDDTRRKWRCMRFAAIASSGDKAPAIQRIGIGADGTWHYFWSRQLSLGPQRLDETHRLALRGRDDLAVPHHLAAAHDRADRPAGDPLAVVGRPAGASRRSSALVIVSRRFMSTTVKSAS